MQKITEVLLLNTLKKASASPRLRMNHNFHPGLDDIYQRMLNCLIPGTYLRPHRHTLPEKSESILILKGSVLAIEFENDGKISDFLELNSELGNYGIDILPGIYHTLIPITETIIFEAKQGPYSPLNEMDFAPWAPPEGSDAAIKYQKMLLDKINKM